MSREKEKLLRAITNFEIPLNFMRARYGFPEISARQLATRKSELVKERRQKT